MAGKRTSDLIPLCHPLALSSLTVTVAPNAEATCFIVTAHARAVGPTGVEMEALTAVSTACLTIFDMLKAIDREMIIEDIKVLSKSGGASGDFVREP
jgi:cyclic pyranopterin phosphate synthase